MRLKYIMFTFLNLLNSQILLYYKTNFLVKLCLHFFAKYVIEVINFGSVPRPFLFTLNVYAMQSHFNVTSDVYEQPPLLPLTTIVASYYHCCYLLLLSVTIAISYHCCQLPLLSQLPLLPVANADSYQCCQLPLLSATIAVSYHCCQLPLLSVTIAISHHY